MVFIKRANLSCYNSRLGHGDNGWKVRTFTVWFWCYTLSNQQKLTLLVHFSIHSMFPALHKAWQDK
jgi:hypothetical protein